MGTEAPATPKPDKEVTVPVPEDLVPEFYAFYARFLAAGRPGGRRSRRRGPYGCGCGRRHEDADATQEPTVAGETPPTTPPPQAPAA
jgi:hypothetical protein